ncbi:type I polyketide synthase [Fodinicola acaciae]|uniref:type I polyketide synthase n=1 Tax=Fodinicola acaciae TaxID=2681555 RepID=UPI0013D23B35|nr:type I polyketide synthase [Fodinicola acaciae]
MSDDQLEPIAVIGTAARVPGAATVRQFWENLRDGVESISRFDPAELVAAGVDPRMVADPDFVPVSGAVDGADLFDAEFFGFSPSEAALLDPQHRLFLECAWEALEDAGHDPARFDGAIGVYAGSFMNKYLPINLYTNERFMSSAAAYFARNYNDKDFLAGRVAYLFDLRGPAVTVQTACSTSLVATHLACQALLNYECDAALVGGVAVNVPLKSGYPKVDGGLLAPDGHCRPFDAHAGGTVPGFGCAVVMLRRLSDAIADRDDIRAVIRGTAINNDGAAKVSFTAPNVRAQAEVIATAQAVAGVSADSIGYLEAHGTATPMGDPIEVAALTDAFRVSTDRRGFCALGSVKANIGHLDAAAGVAGLLRAVLALRNKTLPPVVNFRSPNPQLNLDESPFYVPTSALAWPAGDAARRAGVSSFGVGGTNAHVVLEEAPPAQVRRPAEQPWQLLPISARTNASVTASASRLADAVADLRDTAYTLQVGRRGFDRRAYVVAGDAVEAADLLRSLGRPRVVPSDRSRVVFCFPGGGSQHPDMAWEIYRHQPVFASEVDRCAELLRPMLGADIRGFLFPSAFSAVLRDDPPVVLAGIFAVEYALAKLWMSWGIEPAALLGHSLGEYAAACLAGVFRLPDALDLTVRRGELFAAMPAGRMLSVALSEAQLRSRLDDRLSVAAVNAPELTLVSGPRLDIERLAGKLAADGVDSRLVHIDVASHSWMVEPYLADFEAAVGKYALAAPAVPVLSGVTGRWLTAEEATSPAYWAGHLRQPVRFADCVREATRTPGAVMLEVGPGQTLTSLIGAQRLAPPPVAVASLPRATDPQPALKFLLGSLGRLWQAGVEPDWEAVHGDPLPRRVPLPTYAFQRRRHWIPPGRLVASAPADDEVVDEPAEAGDEYEPPVGRHETAVARLWQELLGQEKLDRYDDFAALGGHSLLAAQFVKRLRADEGWSLTVRDVFAHPTVAELGGLLARRSAGEAEPRPAVDLVAEAVLDPSIVPAAPVRSGPPGAVLLTGATGFLGTFLCAELLAQTDAVVHCLVRAPDAAAGHERILARLADSGLPVPDADRIVAVPGDLAVPAFGLPTEAYDALGRRVDAIYHCGAWVNFVRPYRALKAANVLGTQEILRMAAKHGTPVHHVSTLAVLAGGVVGGADELSEDGPLPPPVGHDTAYSESKWVAEKLVRIAAERGVPASVYRPGVVLGDSRTGVSNVDDYMTAMVTGCVRLGLAPLRHYPQSVASVDDVARVIVAISLRTPANGATFHPLDPRPLPWNELFDHVRAAGYPVRSVPFDEWRQMLAQRLEAGDDNALEPLAGNLSAATGDRRMPRFGTENVDAALAGELPRPVLDDRYFRTVLDYFTRRGWLPPPNRSDDTP